VVQFWSCLYFSLCHRVHS